MEKSIESIWEEGFLEKDALVAPFVNDLYNQKSEHITEKYKRMFRINIVAILVGSLPLMGITYLLGIPFMGIGISITLYLIVIINHKLFKSLKFIDKGVNSYDYLKSFDSWMKDKISINETMARYYYPMFFWSVVFGIWASEHSGRLFEKIIDPSNHSYLINGVPAFLLIPIALLTVTLWFAGPWLYRLDLNIVYGRVLKKFDEILADMEELRAE